MAPKHMFTPQSSPPGSVASRPSDSKFRKTRTHIPRALHKPPPLTLLPTPLPSPDSDAKGLRSFPPDGSRLHPGSAQSARFYLPSSPSPVSAKPFSPVSRASFLLAQVSLASSLPNSPTTPKKFSSFGTSGAVLRVGPGLDGALSRETGFVNHPSSAVQESLPKSLSAWEAVHTKLPILLRCGVVREAIDSLPPLERAWEWLPERHLARAAIVLSIIGHAYFYGHRDENPPRKLPEHVLRPWRRVCERLGRPFVGRVPADDLLNNALPTATPPIPFALSSAAFGLPEERLSSGLQGAMELRFAPALETMAQAQTIMISTSSDEPTDDTLNTLASYLESLATQVVSCATLFQAITPSSVDFDPLAWIKTYPAMGAPIPELVRELGNSGVDAPLFHALDAFIGRERNNGDLRGMQTDRRSTLPRNVRAFLEALESPSDHLSGNEVTVRHFVTRHGPDHPRLRASFDALLQIYVWFLERHRVKAVGITGVTLGSGRHTTSSGVKSRDGHGAPPIAPDAMLSKQMKAGMESRLAGRPLWQIGKVEGRVRRHGDEGAFVAVVKVRVDARLPLEAGDRVQVWLEGEDDDRPRFYSIAKAIPDSRGMVLTLTVGHCALKGGCVSKMLASAEPGMAFRVRPWPCLRFRQPEDLTTPLILIGQGSGIGPLVGFLHERAQRKSDQGVIPGQTLLFISATTRARVPVKMGTLERLSAILPDLTILLALSKERHIKIRAGRRLRMTDYEARPGRVTRHLVAKRGLIEHLVGRRGAHLYLCGSTDFGVTVADVLQLLFPSKQGIDAKPTSSAQDRVFVPSPCLYSDRLHWDLFGSSTPAAWPAPGISALVASSASDTSDSKENSLNPSKSALSLPTVTLAQLAMHNSPSSCWTAISGTVYDITGFLVSHPGGAKTLLESAGMVADRRFYETHGGPHLQEIKGYLGRLAIGTLADEDELPEVANIVLNNLVRVQNALLNNTAFTVERSPVPFYAYCDALHVFAENVLDEVKNLLDGDELVMDDPAPARRAVEQAQEKLVGVFTQLRAGCREMLAQAPADDEEQLKEIECLVMGRYRHVAGKIHARVDVCKQTIGAVDDRCAMLAALESFGWCLVELAEICAEEGSFAKMMKFQ